MRTQTTVAGLGAAAALAVIALNYQAPAGTQLFSGELMTAEDHEFIKYVAKYGKSYGTKAEFEFRSAQFKETLGKVAAHNSENGTSTVGINEFSDKTSAEMSRMLGYKQQPRNLTRLPSRKPRRVPSNPLRINTPTVGVYIVMVGIDAIEIASDAIVIASQRSTDHILAGQTAT